MKEMREKMNNKIRLLEINVKNLKNLKNGTITFSSYNNIKKGAFDFEKSDIVGIYGQNGSSKSSVVNAFSILKRLFTNNPISSSFSEYISKDESFLEISLTMYYNYLDNHYIYTYMVKMEKVDNAIFIASESLTYRKYINDKWSNKKALFEIRRNVSLSKFITPITNLNLLLKKDKDAFSKLLVLKGQKEINNCSFLLSKEFGKILQDSDEFCEFAKFIESINLYSIHSFHLYENREITQINNLDLIPIMYRRSNDTLSNISINLFQEGFFLNSYRGLLQKYVEEINEVLSKLVKGFKLDFIDLGSTIDEKGNACFKYLFVSKKEDYHIPLYLESDGIKKIISILVSFVDTFNNPFAILIIDEFDSGIFEYLLGVILSVFKSKGEGQLLFTSHNLRALEVIKDDIVFTTTNELNRFTKLPYVKPSNNLRNVYLRDIYLDNTDQLVNRPDEYEIYRALVKAKEICEDENEE